MLKELQVRIGATTVEFQRKMQEVQATVTKVGNTFSKFSQQATQSFSNVTKSLEKNADSIRDFGETTSAYFTLPIGLAGMASIKMASDFQESLNKVNVAFGNSASDVVEWSKTSIDSMGMASGTALDSAALFGDMATSMGIGQAQASNMSKSLVQLGADMASFKNVPIEQAMQALNGVFTGETESLKMLGVVMTQTQLEAFALSKGIQKNVQDMTEAELINLRYAFVMDRTKNAQGDFARTAGGSANQMRIFWESLKEVGKQIADTILPAFTTFLTYINKLLKGFMSLSDGTKFLVAVLGGLLVAIPPLITAIGMLGQALPFITGGFDKMGKSMKFALGGITLLISALVSLGIYFGTTENAGSKFTKWLDELQLGIKYLSNKLSTSFKLAKNEFLISLHELEIGFLNFSIATGKYFGLTMESAQKELEQLQQKIDTLNTENANIQMNFLRDSTNATNELLKIQNNYIGDLMSKYNYWTKSIADHASSKGREAIELKEKKVAETVEKTNKKVDEQKKKMEELAKKNLDFAKTLNDAVIKALENKNEAITESIKITQDSIEAEKEALEDLKKTYEDQYEQIAETIDENYKTQFDQIKERYENEVDIEKDLTQTKIDEVEKRRKNLENQIANEIAFVKDQEFQQKKQAILNEMFQYKNLKTREEVIDAIAKLTIEREKDLNADGNSLKLEAIEEFTDEENKLIRDRLNSYRKLEFENLTDRIEALKVESQTNLSNKKLMYENDINMLKHYRDLEHEQNKLNRDRNIELAKEESDRKIAYFNAEIKLKEKGLVDLSSEEKKQMVAKRLLLESDHKETKALLNEFNKDYYIAGRDFASELLKGLESKKSDITKLMAELATPYKPSEPVKSVLERGKEFGEKATQIVKDAVASITPNSLINPILLAPTPAKSIYGVDSFSRTYSDLSKNTTSEYVRPQIFLDSREITKAVAPNMVDTVRAKTGFY